MFDKQLGISEIVRFYHQDFVILEGVSEAGIPAIITAHSVSELDERLTPFVFAVSGKISSQINQMNQNHYHQLPAIDATADITALTDLVERKVYDYLPMNTPECCGLCGFDCKTLGQRIIAGESSPDDCLLQKRVTLTVNGREIEMVPFVQAILKNAVLGVAKELRGYEKGQIQVNFADE
jgi:molybdopterin-guanine dinucleotide biosynthesis protein B